MGKYEMIKYSEEHVISIQKAISNLRSEIINGVEPRKAIDTHFKGLEYSFCGGQFKQPGKLIFYRIIPWEVTPKLLKQSSYNPNNDTARCHLKGSPVFYGTNMITSGIMESMVKSSDLYKSKFNDLFAGMKFIVGEWHLELKDLYNVNFNYSHEINNSPTVNAIIQAFETSIENLSLPEKKSIKKIVKLFHDLFYDDVTKLTASFCNSIMYKGREDDIEIIFYPSAIKPMISNNIALSTKIADSPEKMQPVKFNFCELFPLTNQEISQGGIRYQILEVGLPDGENIKWFTDKYAMNEYRIEDQFWYRYGNRWIYRKVR